MVETLEKHEMDIREFLARGPFGLHIRDKTQMRILLTAFTHNSFIEEYNRKSMAKLESYQRLEFLGDAVLEYLVCDEAYRMGSLLDEGQMTNDFKQKAVANRSIAKYLRDAGVDIGGHILLGNSFSAKEGGNQVTDDMVADVFEAFVAALYLTFGMECARSLVDRIILGPLKRTLG